MPARSYRSADKTIRGYLESFFFIEFERKGTGLFLNHHLRGAKVKILHIKAKIGSTRTG